MVGRGRTIAVHVGLAALVYVPLLLTQPGWVGADTKQYLYLDPGRLLRKAPYMWDATVGMGTVTHQTIGYLFPMGPYYWAMEQLGLPDWVAQRLWLGTILFAAGAGVLFLARTLDWRGAGPIVAALAFMLSPYPLAVAARISVLLLPWAALPWMVAIVIRAIRQGGWRWPALFALVVAVVGGVNATALIYAGVGPVLWFPFAVWVTREASLRQAASAFARVGILTAAVSVWWIVALSIQGRYGLPVLAFSETFDTVATTSIPSEILRGLGYWFFYGSDKLGPWIEPSTHYTEVLWLLAVSFLLPLLAFAAAAVTRWRHRAYFVALVVTGTVIGVGSYPFDDPSPLGSVFEDFATESTAGLALRSHARAVPLVVLGTAVLLGIGVTGLTRRVRPAGLAAAALIGVLAIANLPPLWQGDMVGRNLRRDEEVPDYWQEATAYLDQRGDDTRVLEIPGSDFASYRWGNTVDAITPGLMDRPMVARELIPFGTPPSADLLIALDRRLQEGLFEPASLAPVARLMAAGDVLLRADLQYERYRTPRPWRLWDRLTPVPDGLTAPATFGEGVPNQAVPELPLIDEITLGMPAGAATPPALAAFGVRQPRTILRAETAERPLLVAGDGEAIVEAAAAGMLPERGVVLYGAALSSEEGGLARAMADGADLLLTDTNRKRARRWRTVRENYGFTERVDEPQVGDDLSDARLEVFPDAPVESFTVAEHRGGAGLSASGYGNPISYTPDDRPVLAMDGDPKTAWRVGALDAVQGERLVIGLDRPLTTDRVTLLQPVTGVRNRWITEAVLRFDDGSEERVQLSDQSRAEPGQVVTFARRTFGRLEIEVSGDNVGDRPRWGGVSGVGFAEVGLGDPPIRVEEVIRPPTDVLDVPGVELLEHRLSILFARERSDPAEPVRTDPEPSMVRAVRVPDDRSFSFLGTARLSAYVPDEVIDALVGGGGATARSSSRLPGSLAHRAAAAVDGDPSTEWSPSFLDQVGHWVEYETGAPVTFDRLDLQLVADGRHSVPTRLRVEPAGGEPLSVALPAVSDGDDPGDTAAAPVELPRPVTATRFRIVVEEVRQVRTVDWYSDTRIVMPVGIAEIGIPGVAATPPPEQLPGTCRGDLLTIDGTAVGVRVLGTTAAALARQGLAVELCDGANASLDLAAGDHVVRTATGRDLGIDIDRLALLSERGGGPVEIRAGRSPAQPQRRPRPAVEVVEEGNTGMTVRIDNPGEPFWLVLGQSHSPGWEASVDGRALGEARLVDGYANGWYVEPPERPGPMTFSISWRPQRLVWVGLGVSLLALLACIALAVVDPRRRPAAAADDPAWVFPAMPPEPELASPLLSYGRPRSTAAAVAAAIVAGVVAGAVADPLLGVAVAAAVLATLLTRRGRAVVTVGAVGGLALSAIYVLVQQYRHGYPADFTWPENFRRINLLAWAAVLLLGADALAERLRARRRGDRV